MIKTYNVAGHKFSLEMPDGHILWAEMDPYLPFECESVDDCLFSVELVNEIAEVENAKPILVDNSEPDQPRIELYEAENEWRFVMAPLAKAAVTAVMVTDKEFNKAQLVVSGEPRFSLHSAMMLMYAFRTAKLDTLLMHASVTMNGGKGYLFLGKSGTGKSTHSRLWIENIEGSELLNDDNPILRVMPDGTVRVFGSPWSGKTPCYRNLDVPVGAIVRIRRAKENRIQAMSLPEAYASLYTSSSGIKFVREMADGLHATNEKIVTTVPCYAMYCLPDAEAAQVCYQAVTQ